MLPKRKTPPTPPHIANDDHYKEPSISETKAEKTRRLDRKRKAVTKCLELVSATDRSQSFISTILLTAFTKSTTLKSTSTNSQQREYFRSKQQEYRQILTIVQQNQKQELDKYQHRN
ncbi:4693_t:CDS:2, partial [Racocetra persica]